MCFLQNGLTSHMDPYTNTNVKTLKLGVALLYLGPIYLYTRPFDTSNHNSTTWGPLL